MFRREPPTNGIPGFLCSKARLLNCDPRDTEALKACADRFEITWDEEFDYLVFNGVFNLMQQGCWPANIKAQGIDFDDMIWLPVINNLRPFAFFDLVVGDEIQDWSPAQTELVMKFLGRRGRFVGLGDDLQAIYAFTGADSDSMGKIIERTQAEVLSLPICYRCDEAIIEVAQFWAPDIQARPGAGKGTVEVVEEDDAADTVQAGDLVLGRKNKTLIKWLFRFIRAGKPAVIKGRPELTDSFVDTAKALERFDRRNAWDHDHSETVAQRYIRQERRKILGLNRNDTEDPAIETLIDRVSSTQLLIQHTRATSLSAFERAITSLFDTSKDDSTSAGLITLSSAHRAKGLGCRRVFILKPEDFPMVRREREEGEFESYEAYERYLASYSAPEAIKAREEAAQQEANLMYVAVTRAKQYLGFIGGWGGFSDAVSGTSWYATQQALEKARTTGTASFKDIHNAMNSMLGMAKANEWSLARIGDASDQILDDFGWTMADYQEQLEMIVGPEAAAKAAAVGEDVAGMMSNAGLGEDEIHWTEGGIEGRPRVEEPELPDPEDAFLEGITDERLDQIEALWTAGKAVEAGHMLGFWHSDTTTSPSRMREFMRHWYEMPGKGSVQWALEFDHAVTEGREDMDAAQDQADFDEANRDDDLKAAEARWEAEKAEKAATDAATPAGWRTEAHNDWDHHGLFDVEANRTYIVRHKPGAVVGMPLARLEVHEGDVPLDPTKSSAATLRAEGTIRLSQGRALVATFGDEAALGSARTIVKDAPLRTAAA